jgi:hypothetical protein
MPDPTVFNEDFTDIEFFCLHAKKSKVIIFSLPRKLTGRTGFFKDEIGFYGVRHGFLLSGFENSYRDSGVFFEID